MPESVNVPIEQATPFSMLARMLINLQHLAKRQSLAEAIRNQHLSLRRSKVNICLFYRSSSQLVTISVLAQCGPFDCQNEFL
jgi:hypothetical protein